MARLRGAQPAALPPMRPSGSAPTRRRPGRWVGSGLRAASHRVRLGLRAGAGRGQQPRQPGDRRRSFGANPPEVGAPGRGAGGGMEQGGVASYGKHFPGHGDTLQDSHLTLPVLEHGLARVSRRWAPSRFRAYAGQALASVMTAHVRFGPRRGRRRDDEPRLHHRAAAKADRLRRGGGQRRSGDEGDLRPDGSRGGRGPRRSGPAARLPSCGGAAPVLDALVAAARKGIVTEERLREAHARIDALVGRFVRPRRIESVSSDRRSTAG